MPDGRNQHKTSFVLASMANTTHRLDQASSIGLHDTCKDHIQNCAAIMVSKNGCEPNVLQNTHLVEDFDLVSKRLIGVSSLLYQELQQTPISHTKSEQ
jgi:hypothetical protein